MTKIAVIVGSLRRESINKKLAHALAKLAKPGTEFTFSKIDDLPLFSQDLEPSPPAAVTRLKGEIEAADGVLIVTPEYNRSIPGVLKNAIDWASRPYGKNSFAGKPTAAIGTAMGSLGTAAAQQHLRSILAYLHVVLMGQPEGYIVFKQGLVDDSHTVTDENVRKFLQTYMEKFGEWIERHGEKK
ncbi:MAG: NAD(P)H-dependent oxidoreductase [Sphingomonadales bacterium]|jgi:chromate reductase|nr:NAD(P)H-dependent oxidoreductase [Sphingomonadales bacterium]NKB16575.1 NAD(P)H-dependent oxidoreductase [Sphingomonadales bacterium]